MSDLRVAALADDWTPTPGLLSKNERDELSEDEQRTLARNRLGIYELTCAGCGQLCAVQVSPTEDEVWYCEDCRRLP